MNRSILVVLVTLSCAFTAFSQGVEKRTNAQASGDTAATAKTERNLEIASGTRLAGELQNTLDVRKAQVGDQVVLRTTRAIKSGGQLVVGKGARLIGHVTEVTQKSKDSAVSSIGVVFDRLEKGSLTFPISATLSSITNATTNARSGGTDPFASDAAVSSSSSSRASAPANSGGLLGGVTTTAGAVLNSTTAAAGSVVGATTSAVGSTVNATSNVVGATANGVGSSLGRIQISESSSTSAEGGAVLSLRGENLRIEKGTNFNLVLNQSANASAAKQQ